MPRPTLDPLDHVSPGFRAALVEELELLEREVDTDFSDHPGLVQFIEVLAWARLSRRIAEERGDTRMGGRASAAARLGLGEAAMEKRLTRQRARHAEEDTVSSRAGRRAG